METALSRNRPSGFTLVEVLVALAVLLLATLAAGRLLVESGVVLARSVARARDPRVEWLEARLRADLVQGRGVGGLVGSWDPGELEIAAGDRSFRWWRDGERMVRAVESADPARRAAPRPWAGGVVGWRWRLLPQGLVEVEVTTGPTTGGWVGGVRGPLHLPRPGARRRLHLVIALRQLPGREGW